MMDKDGRSRNRLSHTSAPLYFAKSKRPAPTDLDGVGATNRLPGGQQGQQQQQQQVLSRRQRSLQAKGKSSRHDIWSDVCKHEAFLFDRSKQSLSTYGRTECGFSWRSFSFSCRRKVGSLSDESAYRGDKPGDPRKGLRDAGKLQVRRDEDKRTVSCSVQIVLERRRLCYKIVCISFNPEQI